MKLTCLIGRHSPRPGAVSNQGFTFARCAGCKCDLVRSMGRWQTVPKGFRVVWRGAGGAGPPAGKVAATAGPATVDAAREGAWIKLATLGSLAGAGLRAFTWSLGDRVHGWSRRIRTQRRPALLRLPAP